MLARHFCNELILRDCEKRLMRYVYFILVSFDTIRILYTSCNMPILYFMRYVYFILYAIRLFHTLREKSILYEGLGSRVYIEGSASIKS